MLGLVRVALAASLLAPPELPAERPTTHIDVQWRAPAGCPANADIERDLAHVGGAERGGNAAILARVRAEGSGFRLELQTEVGGETRTRSLFSTRCDTLARAVVLIAAVDVGILGASASVEIPRAQAARVLEVPAPVPIVAERPAPEPSPRNEYDGPGDPPPPASASPQPFVQRRERQPLRRNWTHRAILSAGAGPSLGVTPRITAAVVGRVGWRLDKIQIEAAAFHHFSSTRTVVGTAAISGRLTGAGVRGCYVHTAGALEFPVCGGVALGSLRTEPNEDVSRGIVNRDVWVGATADAGIAWPIRPRFALVVDAQLGVALRRPAVHWTVAGERQLAFRAAPAGFLAFFGPQIRLP